MSARMPWKKSEPMEQRIEFCCKALRGGNFRALCREYGRAASESSFKRVLDRSGLTRKRRVRLASQSGRLCSGRKAEEPNQVWTVDFKGWWNNGLQRCEPLTV